MSLDLDERRRGMLEEMGIRIWPELQSGRVTQTEPVEGSGAPVGAPRQAAGKPPVAAALSPANTPLVVAAEPVVARGPAAAVDSMQWEALSAAVANCRACNLCEGRTQTVFGVGDTQPDWLIVGEAPGENEDLQGEPFVGQAGKLLDNMLKSIGLERGRKVYIANVLKCRPPGNRNPQPDEVAQCEPFLRRQVELLQPRIILAMGRFAAQTLLASAEPIGKLRGRAYEYLGVPLVVTYHPAYLLRNLPDKAKAWADLCLAQELIRTRAERH
jgi:uracil-DNA glycosylase